MFAPAVQPAAGFTLVELAVVCAIAGVLAAVALPSYQSHLLRAGRADAVDALTRLQMAQDFIAAIAKHRHWGRGLLEQVPA